MNFSDSGRPPSADYREQRAYPNMERAPYDISVTLQTWGPQENLFANIYNKAAGTWGSHPQTVSTDNQLSTLDWQLVEGVLNGRSLPQHLEFVGFSFLIEGVTRACTHQIVRTRIGAGFNQHGGRTNDWLHQKWTVPETLTRLFEYERDALDDDKEVCFSRDEYERIMARLRVETGVHERYMEDYVHDALQRIKDVYAALVDLGIPYQDARRLLPIGSQTFIFAHYSYPALKGFLANRLETQLDWEINCVAQLMLRELNIHCPPRLVNPIMSHSERAGLHALARDTIFPPSGRHAVPDDLGGHEYQYPASANPFWVLAPDSMEGGDVRWISTNGTWPPTIHG